MLTKRKDPEPSGSGRPKMLGQSDGSRKLIKLLCRFCCRPMYSLIKDKIDTCKDCTVGAEKANVLHL